LCGIAGIWNKSESNSKDEETVNAMLGLLSKRGPDAQAIVKSHHTVLGHTRLSIIDLNERSNQPITAESGRYSLTFNGEIYNYKSLKVELENTFQTKFKTQGDAEVLLYGLIWYGVDFVKKINGFFAFAFYDNQKNTLIIARDRFGIKPLYYKHSHDRFSFSSSLSSLMKDVARPEICLDNLATYLQLSYSPAPNTILKNVYKLMPGSFITIDKTGVNQSIYYYIPDTLPFSESQKQHSISDFKTLMHNSVRNRLQADVPLGTFLSGGFDSSVIALLASRDKPDIPTFSIGFPDQPFFDESKRATAIARHLGVKHHLINISDKEISDKVSSIFDDFDEPFADSSAILVQILCEYARKEVKVVLSGDGADEIMGGYNKHRALLRSMNRGFVNTGLKATSRVWDKVPESRNTHLLNALRKVKRYSKGLNHNFTDRYFKWSSFTPRSVVNRLLLQNTHIKLPDLHIDPTDFNTILRADTQMVLPNDMLHKVDVMSMSRGLEVRVPYLDHHLVNFLFKLPASEKIHVHRGKLILHKAFEDEFPKKFFNSPKKGFEAPLSDWLKGPLSELTDHYLSEAFLNTQGIFSFTAVKELETKAKSNFPGDSPHTIWAILVFQSWYSKHFLGK